MAVLRELRLDKTKGQLRFDVLYIAFAALSQTPHQPPKGIELLRREAQLISKLHAISEPDTAGLTGGSGRTLLKKATLALILDQPEIELLRARIAEMPGWSTVRTPDVVDAYDWLGTGSEKK